MMKNINPFKKIDQSNIELQLSGGNVAFTYIFNEKQEKELNLAAGRIHRKATAGQGTWKLEGYTLTTTYALTKIEDSTFTFGDIASLFEEMIR